MPPGQHTLPRVRDLREGMLFHYLSETPGIWYNRPR